MLYRGGLGLLTHRGIMAGMTVKPVAVPMEVDEVEGAIIALVSMKTGYMTLE